MSENTFPTAKLCMDANWIREIFLRTIRVWRFKSGSLPTEINISFFWAPGWLSGNTLNSAPCTGSWVWALMMTNSFLDPSTTSTLSSWFYLVYLIWYYYLSVKFVLWIVKQKIENKRNLFKKTFYLDERKSSNYCPFIALLSWSKFHCITSVLVTYSAISVSQRYNQRAISYNKWSYFMTLQSCWLEIFLDNDSKVLNSLFT